MNKKYIILKIDKGIKMEISQRMAFIVSSMNAIVDGIIIVEEQ